MTFNSLAFLIFFPIVAGLYFVLPKKLKWPMLLIASYYFYMFYQAELVILIFSTTLISWVLSFVIEKTQRAWLKRVSLCLTLVSCLGVLFFFKYFGFAFEGVSSIISLFGLEAPTLVVNFVLPVGISFYTFQTLSYVIDVYRGKIKTERNFLFYALFVSFFPQLVAGPIERPEALMPQLREVHKFSWDNARRGFKYMALGFFKKICVADFISVYVDKVYNNPEGATSLGVIIATALFAVQIYCDFSGYTDIATGAARVMGIRLMKNFDHPYMATTVKEFWARWHISLSSWFRDYLYIPLGGNRKGRVRRYLNVFLVFLVSGLWHGANLTYVVWGALHGIYQIVGSLTSPLRKMLLEKCGICDTSAPVLWAKRVIVTTLVSAAWLVFRAGSISEVGILLTALFTRHASIGATLTYMGLTPVAILTVIFSIAILNILDRLLVYGEGRDGSDALIKHGAVVYIAWLVILSALLLLSRGVSSTFIYFQF